MRSCLVLRFKVWLESKGRYAFGFGITEILQAVAVTGSIKQAASDLDRSYRHVWGRIKAAEDTLGCRLVKSQVGGRGTQRSFLTGEASQMVQSFLSLRARMTQLVEEAAGRMSFL
jgi:molybdate transport system regulatory protein